VEGTKVSVDVVKGWVEKAKNEEVSFCSMGISYSGLLVRSIPTLWIYADM
jgi:hypothetical protein